MKGGWGATARAIADVLKTAMKSTAHTLRLLLVLAVVAVLFIGVLWALHSMGWTTEDTSALLYRWPARTIAAWWTDPQRT